MGFKRFMNVYGQLVNYIGVVTIALVPMYFYAKSDRVPKTDEDLQQELVSLLVWIAVLLVLSRQFERHHRYPHRFVCASCNLLEEICTREG
jgi:hypothetical protein